MRSSDWILEINLAEYATSLESRYKGVRIPTIWTSTSNNKPLLPRINYNEVLQPHRPRPLHHRCGWQKLQSRTRLLRIYPSGHWCVAHTPFSYHHLTHVCLGNYEDQIHQALVEAKKGSEDGRYSVFHCRGGSTGEITYIKTCEICVDAGSDKSDHCG
ncbi:hypothetical protein IQ06DRAFT_57728 [Phaeosphaeriaceae sp. SRC1lsM3a]|nr:hypothetical protein IQ06DRAFT_57728 [Stagonospora sp. SRC1lsM3a]